MQRYFALKIDDKFCLSKEDEHHLINVMRAKKHEQIEIVYDNKIFLCDLSSTKPLAFNVIKEIDQESEIKENVTLFFSLAKGDKIDFVIQKATELGVKRIVLIKTRYCVIKYSEEDIEKKLIRYRRIAKEAAMQCKRTFIPEVVGVYDINQIPASLLCDLNFVAYELDKGVTNPLYHSILDNKDKSISVLIGPEGGLAKEEIEYLTQNHFQRISLGKRILRTETAAVYALSVIGFLKELL